MIEPVWEVTNNALAKEFLYLLHCWICSMCCCSKF